MVELDVFETRFTAAYRRYLDEAPTEVDPSSVARAAGAAGGSAGWRAWWWNLRPASATAIAWLALLLLLLAAVGAALIAGSLVPRHASACPSGTRPDQPGPVGQARPWLTSYQGTMAFDRARGSIVLADPFATWTFDVCTNTWARAGTGVPVGSPDPGRVPIVYDSDSNLTIAVDNRGHVWTFDVQGGQWIKRGPAPWSDSAGEASADSYYAVRLVDDDRTGEVLALLSKPARVEVWSYDVTDDRWQPLVQAAAPWPGVIPVDPASGTYVTAPLTAWDASAGRLIALRMIQRLPQYELHGEAARFDPVMHSWSAAADAPPMNLGYGPSGGEFVYADSVKRTIAFSDGLVIAYDTGANRWDILAGAPFLLSTTTDVLTTDVLTTGPLARLGHEMVYDPLNQRLVVIGGQYRVSDPTIGWVSRPDDVWAFDPATRQWTELLKPNGP